MKASHWLGSYSLCLAELSSERRVVFSFLLDEVGNTYLFGVIDSAW